MSLLDRVAVARGRRGRKAFAEPPFWAHDELRLPWLSASPVRADREKIENSFEAYVQSAYKANGIVFGCIAARQRVYSQARFQWREFRDGRPGRLFGSSELALLEKPWPTGTTGELLSRMEVVASLAGNYYGTTADAEGRLGRSAQGPSRRVVHMRPDWTDIIIDAPSGHPFGLDARVVAFSYWPPAVGGASRPDPVVLLPEEVVHYSPIPDPIARFRGMSWLTPVLEEIRADKLATRHKGKFFENGAHSGMAIVFNENTSPEAFNQYVEKFKEDHQGTDNAYKTLFLAGGADLKPLTMDFKQMDFKVTQGAGETRVAVAAGVPAVLLGISEGLQGSSLNAGNYGAAKRNFGETTLFDLWSKTAASLQTLVTPPRPGVSLWFDARDIPFLRDNASDLADIRVKDAQAIRTLVDGGFDPDAAVDYMQTNDLQRLMGRHTGLLPVQLQPPGSGEDTRMSPNGSRNGQQVAA